MELDLNIDFRSQQELAEIAILLDQEVKGLDEDKLSFYHPHPGQLEFHQSNALIRLLITGNRFGKSTASVNEGAWLSLGLHPYKKMQVPNRGKMYGESFKLIERSLIQKFHEWVPSKYLAKNRPYEKNPAGDTVQINYSCGSTVAFGTYDQHVKKSESTDWDWVAFDEPPPRDVFIACLRGLVDRGGYIWIAATPLSEAWLYDQYWIPGIRGTKKYVHCISGSTYENPHLNKETLEIFTDELTEDEKEVRIEGKFSKLKGVVIDTYNSLASDIDPFELTSDFTIYEGIDPHPSKPHAALWKAIDPFNRRFVVAELKHPGSMRSFGKEIAKQRRELCKGGAILYQSICDTSLNQTDPAFRINLADELCQSLKEEGEVVMPRNAQKRDWLFAGIDKIKDLYRMVKQVIDDDEVLAPMEYVFNTCTAYKYELTHYQWPKNVLEETKPVSLWNDLIDCNRYIESVAPIYQTPGQSGVIHTFQGAYNRLSSTERYKLPSGSNVIRYPTRTMRRV